MRRMSASVSTVLALGLLLTACGGGEEDRQVAQKCDSTLSPEAVKALGSLLGTEAFRSGGVGLGRITEALIQDQATPGGGPGLPDLCEVTADGDLRSGVKIDAVLYGPGDLYDDGTKWQAQGRHLYAMGREASADNKDAHLFVGCSSPRLKGSDKAPAPLHAMIRSDGRGKGAYPENTPATREAYLTVLHSVTLAVVRKLGCENDAGLPEKPVFEAKKWRGER
ncbi:hypothetical protein ACIRQY_30170 [Streptomyces sp. NPDC101490]|uniref:hypothetical protein n=1 Tax=Streptomyces sp. NPDC101490 TaxID=3366143 RepID=UPI0038016923